MKIFFAGDTSNRTNWGCRATTGMLRRMLQQCGEICWSLDIARPLAPVKSEIISGEKRNAKSVGAFARLKFLLENPYCAGVVRNGFRCFPQILQKYRRVFEVVRASDLSVLAEHIWNGALFPSWREGLSSCDVVVINGEGSFLDNRIPGRLKMLLGYTAKVAFKKPCILINHSADFRNPALREIAEAVYPVLDDVLFRERFSLDNSGYLRGDKPFGLAPDVVFKYSPIGEKCFSEFAGRENVFSFFPDVWGKLDVLKPYICVGGSSAYFNKKVEGFDPLKQYRVLCLALLKVAPVVLTASSEPDDVFFSALSRELNLPFLSLRTPTQIAVDILGNAAAYVGGRWHPGIMALTGGTPVVSFSANTDYKSKGLLELVGLEQRNPSAFDVGAQADYFCGVVQDYIASGEGLRGKLKSRVLELSEQADENLRYLS